MNDTKSVYDVAIVGSGVTGTALFHLLASYTNVGRVVLLEQYNELASVSSHATQNSQTLHFGDIETNYSLEKARSVKAAADMIVRYVSALPNVTSIWKKQQKMVLAVGETEVSQLRARFQEIQTLFPELRLLERDEIAAWEPSVVVGRRMQEPLLALGTEHGFSINFGALAQSFTRRATETRPDFEIQINKRVTRLTREPNGFLLHTQDGSTISARTVVIAAGAHSLSFAHKLGYGRDLSLIPVAGFFYTAVNRLRGKVYTVQHPKLPFAAIHGDPDVLDTQAMRFGPIAKALPLLERGKWSTVWDFFRVFPLTEDAIRSVWKVNMDRIVRAFIWRNVWYDLPWIGPRLFIKEVRKIIPGMQPHDITFGHNLGGIRPQVVHLREHRILLGEAKIVEDGIIFNITPSPGASVCLANALADAKKLVEWLGPSVQLDESAIQHDLLT